MSDSSINSKRASLNLALRKLRKDPPPKQPSWPTWATYRTVWSVPLTVAGVVVWLSGWLNYVLDVSTLSQTADKVAKLAIFFTVVVFLFDKTKEIRDARSIADTEYRQQIQKWINALLPNSTEPLIVRQWALISLHDHLQKKENVNVESKESKQFYSDTQKWQFSDLNLSQLNLNGDFSNRIFRNANLTRADLSGAVLETANLSEADLKEANFAGAKMRNAILSKAMLAKSDLSGADLTGAKLNESLFWDYERRAVAGRAPVSARVNHRTNMSNADFRRADLCHAVFDGANLSGSDFRDASLIGKPAKPAYDACNPARFRKCNLTDSDFRGVNFSGVDLSDANLAGTRLQGADLSEAVGLTRTQLATAQTDGTTLLPDKF